VAKDVAEDELDAVKDGGVKVFIVVSIVIFQRRNPRPTHACLPPTLALGRHVKDAAQDASQDVLGAAEDGSAKVFIVVSIVVFQRRNPRPEHWGVCSSLHRDQLTATEARR